MRGKGCKARVKFDKNFILVNNVDNLLHNHPPPRFVQRSDGIHLRLL